MKSWLSRYGRDPIFKNMRKILKHVARHEDQGKWWRRLFG